MWAIQIANDPDTTGVGTISTVWTEMDGTTFSLSERSTINEAGQVAFIAKAIAARDAWRQKKVDDAAAADVLLFRLNATDTEVK